MIRKKTAAKRAHLYAEKLRAPMPSAPMKYRPDGTVDWGNMWDSFCVLAQEGGPPHRATLLEASPAPDIASPQYHYAASEIMRGITAVSDLTAEMATPGWIRLYCHSPSMAAWLKEAIIEENVAARVEGSHVFVPVDSHFTLKGEIKNVITAVAKTTHYWDEHLAVEVKQVLLLQEFVKNLQHSLRACLMHVRHNLTNIVTG